MSEYLIKEETLTDIADAIRERAELSSPIPVSDMAGKIRGINQEYYDVFWDAFQLNGARTDYSYAFSGVGWRTTIGAEGSGDVFCNCNPKHPIKLTNAAYMFYNNNGITDLGYWSYDIANGVDWSENKSIAGIFQNSTRICNIDEIGASDTMNNAFNGCTNLTWIGKLRLPTLESMYSCMNAFKGCTSLEYLTLEGEILHNNFDVSDCALLLHDSLINIINALSDKSSDTSGTEWVCTLGSTNLAKLTEEEIAVATEKGWTLA